MRLWLWLPDWVFRVLGAAVFVAFLYPRVPVYFTNFWSAGAWFQPDSGNPDSRIYMPWGRLLIDLTYLLIAVSFVVRRTPLRRAERAREIVLPVIAAYWPFLPWMILRFAEWSEAPWRSAYQALMEDPRKWTSTRFLAGSLLIIGGNALDVWGYATLVRSLSIVAEARVLKVTGPYRFVRHPIYLGQMVAQAGVWLFYAPTHVVWIAFWGAFVGMQLYRSRIEDDVLGRAFGVAFADWKKGTFWFV